MPVPVLWDALFLDQCTKWTRDGVANLPSDECLELARWFLRGQAGSSKALVDGICAQCGALLYGAINQRAALSNKCSGPPSNRDGQSLHHAKPTAYDRQGMLVPKLSTAQIRAMLKKLTPR